MITITINKMELQFQGADPHHPLRIMTLWNTLNSVHLFKEFPQKFHLPTSTHISLVRLSHVVISPLTTNNSLGNVGFHLGTDCQAQDQSFCFFFVLTKKKERRDLRWVILTSSCRIVRSTEEASLRQCSPKQSCFTGLINLRNTFFCHPRQQNGDLSLAYFSYHFQIRALMSATYWWKLGHRSARGAGKCSLKI